MTTSTDAVGAPAEAVLGRSWKVPTILGVVTLLALVLFVVKKGSGTSTFALASEGDFFALPAVGVPSFGTGLAVVVALAVVTAYAAFLASQYRSAPLWLLAVFAVLFVFGFLAWAADGETIPVPGLLIGAVALSTPLIFGAMGGVISERVGVINIAIEGQLLAGAFVSAVVASITGSTYVALLAALIAGALTASLLAVFSIRYFVNQVIVGVVLNVLVVGLTSFLYSVVLTKNAETLNSPPRFARIDIPVLSQIPILGPVLFRQTLIVYLMYVAVALVFLGLFHTKWGLRLRAVGEHPQAADTVGINVARTRFWNVCLAGAIAGLGGAYFTLGSVGAFGKEMTAGAGYIALAAVIFGRWDPVRATLAALLFGFASNLQNVLGIIGSPVPSEFMLMLPYVVTIFAVAGLVGHVRGPAAAGKPYASRS
ncbi:MULTISPECIES: ABC transporter permease [unclassified Rhodococcus (in: high G+C Gram-positive bacteria)]|uniref:ABC transporter permease n=1 Tax=unclassified Rhodococcus (in: high G+C Gram-positive bacteria) TaxID=192944 RepID=UPI0015C65956|nr:MULTISPECIES: ABC transporter permease [unclassified Rhodococcus (in: high G+C Gram-positive bacteria)]